MLLPKHIFPKLTDISPEFLLRKGITLLLLDFDNTMLPYTTDLPDKELLDWIQGMWDGGITLCIVSNSHKTRVPDFSAKYHVPCVTHASKPSTRGIFQAMERFHRSGAQTALVGDQIFTDVLGANRAGITSLIVKSIHNHNIWLKLRHVLEVPFLAMAYKRRVKP